MALYHSTRWDNTQQHPSKYAILHGIADDGGLYVTDQLDDFSLDLSDVCTRDFKDIARLVLATFLSDFSQEEIDACVAGAYDDSFTHTDITPLVPVGNGYILELFHGPTSAFKDVALQMLPQLMGRAAADNDTNIMILTATSGDTGKAALAGFADVDHVGISVFYPYQGTSEIQRLQMATQTGDNVFVWAVRGNFDDTQSNVKRIFSDDTLSQRLLNENYILSSANSINIGRLVPQVTYYFYSYAQLVQRGEIRLGDSVEFCVPTGNFGNVLAGWFAKQMGLPVKKFIVASNENNILTDFLTTGAYDRNRPFYKTISPSMDILISSNLERLLYYASGKDSAYITQLMNDLAEHGSYTVRPDILERIQQDFTCGFANDSQAMHAIDDCYDKYGYVLDPHTAVAWHVSNNIPATEGVARIVLATASPYKFCTDVCASLHIALDEGANDFDALRTLEAHTHTKAPALLASLETQTVRFDTVITAEDMSDVVERSCKEMSL